MTSGSLAAITWARNPAITFLVDGCLFFSRDDPQMVKKFDAGVSGDMWRLKRLNSPMISVLLFESRRTEEASPLNAEGRSFLRFSHLFSLMASIFTSCSDCCVKSTSFTTPHIDTHWRCDMVRHPKSCWESWARSGLAGKPHD